MSCPGDTRAGLTQDYAGDDPARCNARCSTRDGKPCRALKVPGGARCRMHGGLSTGPKTAEGRAKVALNLQCQRARERLRRQVREFSERYTRARE